MNFFALGVNHHTASVELREKVAFNAERLAHIAIEIQHIPDLKNMVVVSTCNRTEVYALTEHVHEIIKWMAESNGLTEQSLLQHIYQYENVDAMTHLMRVTSGLDSLMLGEPQIMGQIKNALVMAKNANMVTPQINRLFEFAFYAAKRVRSETAVGEHAISMGYAVAQLASQVFSHMQKLVVMIIAAGEMNTLVAKHLAEMGVGKIIICNRTRLRAEQLAHALQPRVEVEVIDFEQLAQHLHRADVVSSCTGSLHQVVAYQDVKQAIKQRKYQPMLLVDLAVPRDIDDKVEDLDSVYLYGVDDLQAVIDENLSQRRQAALDAEILVSQLASQFVMHEKIHQAGHEIQAFRDQAQQHSQEILEKNLALLEKGADPATLLKSMQHQLMNQLLHVPSKLFRYAAKAEDPHYFEWLNETIAAISEKSRKSKH